MTPCQQCRSTVRDDLATCPTCGAPAGFPNVKLAKLEAAELAIRASTARAEAEGRGAGAALVELEARLSDSQAVVNVDFGFLRQLLTDGKTLYGPYAKLIAAGVRVPAEFANDRQRTAVEGILFGSWGHEIAYAALALDGRGPGSYGPASMEVKPEMIAHRASTLEQNSYAFVKTHGLGPFDRLPSGYRSQWDERRHVGVAKLACRVTPATTQDGHAKLVLCSDGADRGKDDFIEVHIHGSFDRRAIRKVTVLAQPADRGERQRLKALRKITDRDGLKIEWSGL